LSQACGFKIDISMQNSKLPRVLDSATGARRALENSAGLLRNGTCRSLCKATWDFFYAVSAKAEFRESTGARKLGFNPRHSIALRKSSCRRRALAQFLNDYQEQRGAMVLALPRGGVPVGYEVAQALRVPLDVFVVRKLGVPGQEELAMGAIASNGARVLNAEVMRTLQISGEVLESVTHRERLEMQRREQLYRGERAPLWCAASASS
jgi:hypothetical protein